MRLCFAVSVAVGKTRRSVCFFLLVCVCFCARHFSARYMPPFFFVMWNLGITWGQSGVGVLLLAGMVEPVELAEILFGAQH